MDVKVDKAAGRLQVQVSKSIYEKEAVLAATYAMSHWCRNRLEPGPEGWVIVTLELLPACQDKDLQEVESRFLNELIDQQLRLELERRYGGLRQLIVRHAFAPLENLEDEVKNLVGRG
jgi:His-Xaa-Ser system protein HxsD